MQEQLNESFEKRLATLMRLGNCPEEIAREAIRQQDVERQQLAHQTAAVGGEIVKSGDTLKTEKEIEK